MVISVWCRIKKKKKIKIGGLMLLLVEFWLTAWAAVRLNENKKSWWKALLPVGIGFAIALVGVL